MPSHRSEGSSAQPPRKKALSDILDDVDVHFPRYLKSIPYVSDAEATRLQSLDVWLPRRLAESSPETTFWVV